MINYLKRPWGELAVVLALGYVTCFGLFLYGVLLNHSLTYAYLVVNLALASLPLLISWRLSVVLRKKRWSAWEPLALTFFWLIFLPNSFYMISDYIHLQNMSVHILYNAVMFSAFIYLALFMGIISLYIVHLELRKRINPRITAIIVAVVLIGCCFAIYLGRDLRWNSWDIVVNPAGLLFDVSNLLLKPEKYPGMIRTTTEFFVFLGPAYLIAWRVSRLQWHKGVSDLASHIKSKQSN